MRLLRWLLTPDAQVKLAVVQLVAVAILWPLSALTWARGEPQFILGLSWLALALTAHNTIISAVSNRKVHEGSGERG